MINWLREEKSSFFLLFSKIIIIYSNNIFGGERKHLKVILQDGIKDCGICCLLSIIRFYGGDVSKEYLRELTNTTREGVSLYQLQSAAKVIGFEASGQYGTLEKINVNNLPCIAHVNLRKNFQHFVVLYKIDDSKKQVIIMDPAKGKTILSFSEFHMLSSNHYLFLKPIKKLPIFNKKNIIIKQIKKLLSQHKKMILFISLFTILFFSLTIFTSFHFKIFYEYSIKYHLTNHLFILSLFVGIMYFLKNLSSMIQNILLSKWNSFFQIEISCKTYQQILLLPYYYFKNRTTGEVLSRFKDLNVVIEYFSNLFCSFSTDLFTCVLFFLILSKYQITLVLILNCILLIYSLFVFITFKRKKRIFKSVKRNEDITNSYIIQAVSNVDTLKGSHLEKRFIDMFRNHFQKYQDSIYRYICFLGFDNTMKDNCLDVVFLFLYGMGSFYVIREKMSFSSFILFQTFFHYYMSSFLRIIQVIGNYPSFKISLDRVEELFLLNTDNFKNNYYYLSYTLDGDIDIHDLSYQIGTKILFQHLSIHIYPKDKILLYGDSGCGKSTLMKMLLRYIDVEYGKISISNIDINHYHLENIRSYIVYVSANEYLFHDTLRNNITMYQDYPEDEFLKVCHICCVDEIIQEEKGYDMMIEENGFNISNGERQRIILARSILKKRSIVILDEALSQIDIAKEKIILKNLFDYLSEQILIVISHRFHNKKLFQRAFQLKEGILYEE